MHSVKHTSCCVNSSKAKTRSNNPTPSPRLGKKSKTTSAALCRRRRLWEGGGGGLRRECCRRPTHHRRWYRPRTKPAPAHVHCSSAPVAVQKTPQTFSCSSSSDEKSHVTLSGLSVFAIYFTTLILACHQSPSHLTCSKWSQDLDQELRRHALRDMHSKTCTAQTCTDEDVSWHQFEMWVTSTGLPFKSHELFFSLRMPPAAPEVLLAGACLLMFRRSSVTAQQSRILQGERACIWQKHATKRSHFCNVSWHVATNGAVSSCCQEAHCTC